MVVAGPRVGRKYIAVLYRKSVMTAVVVEEVEAKSSTPTITLTMKPASKKEENVPLIPPLHPPGLSQIKIQTRRLCRCHWCCQLRKEHNDQ